MLNESSLIDFTGSLAWMLVVHITYHIKIVHNRLANARPTFSWVNAAGSEPIVT
jgi:hypothetical protein